MDCIELAALGAVGFFVLLQVVLVIAGLFGVKFPVRGPH